jgi:hypothetical protein
MYSYSSNLVCTEDRDTFSEVPTYICVWLKENKFSTGFDIYDECPLSVSSAFTLGFPSPIKKSEDGSNTRLIASKDLSKTQFHEIF